MSKAWLISKNTAHISFTSSKAFPNSLVINKNLLKAESPLAKPDWCGVMPVSNCE
jgi:hypothetical protein